MLQAGVAEGTITPPLGIRLSGYGGRTEPADCVRDDLRCQALVLDDGNTRIALVTCDLIGLPVSLAHTWRAQIAAAVAAPEAHVLIGCSHTHGGPQTGVFGERPTAREAAYLAHVEQCLVGAAEMAAARLQPAAPRLSSGQRRLQRNRRDRLAGPHGPVDDGLGVLVLNDLAAGAPLAVVVHYACHPVALRNNNLGWSADYVGWLREAVTKATGATCIFLQGAAGDLIPDPGHPDVAAEGSAGAEFDDRGKGFPEAVEDQVVLAQRFGRAVGVAAARLCKNGAGAPQATSRRPGATAALRNDAADSWRLGGVLRTFWARFALDKEPQTAAERAAGAPVAFEVQCLRIGPLAMVGLPVEPLNALGLRLRALTSEAEGRLAVWCAGYANGCYGYLAPADEYPRGGYEPGSAHRFYGRPGPFAPDTADRVVEAATSGLTGLWREIHA